MKDVLDSIVAVFANVGFANLFTCGIALTSLAVSWLALGSSHRNSLHIIEIEEARDRDARRRDAKASVIAEGSYVGVKGRTYQLALINRGPAEATKLRVTVDGFPAHGHPSVAEPVEDVTRLGVAARCLFQFVPSLEADRPRKVRIEWEDDSGEPGVYESML
jgi:hypothetical protein